jgi:hypothetical protein
METLSQHPKSSKSEHSIIEVLEFCKAQNLPARVVGKWVWIKFDSKPPAEIRQAPKECGFRWSKRRGQWAHNCGHSSRPARSYRPWDKYRTISVEQAIVSARSEVA